jgi:serine/threonine protein kinase/tetratricopeptide (TPR) repeat protein
MDPHRWQTVNRIFHAALGVPASERESFVSKASEGDPEVERDVKRLLRADSEAESYLETPPIPFNVAADALPSPFTPDETIKNRFRIERHVGQGGMGHVFEAFDLDLKVRVALKVIRPEIASNPAALEYFRREVRTARTITHTNVCRTYDLDKVSIDREKDHPRELYFLTMEFLEGETLASRIRREGPLSIVDAQAIAHQIASGLDSAHQAGIIHRDLKPGNIMLVPRSDREPLPRAVIMDFGLARGDRAAQEESGISHGALVGTLAYMAPEQLCPGQPISGASDVYAFGLLLFEMVTGKPAYPSTDLLNGVAQRLSGPPPSAKEIVPDLPEAWERAILGCLRPEPSGRFESAANVIAVLSGEAVALPRRRTELAAASKRSIWLLLRPWSLTALWVLVMVSLFFEWYRLYQQRRDSEVTAGAILYLSPVLNRTGEKGLDNLTELLEAGLSQSVQINLLDQSRVEDTLQLMTKVPDTSITEPIAREIAMRTGAVRVVIPTVSGLNGGFTLHIDIQQPDNTPVRYRDHWTKDFSWRTGDIANASGAIAPELTQAIRKATDWIRHETGESKNDIARLNTPPENVTTGSWEALQEIAKAADYSRLGRREDAISSLQLATQYDPDCAMAYARIGDLRVQSGHLGEGIRAYLTALDRGSRNRLSERERDYIRGIFALDTENYQAAEDAFRDYSALYEKDYAGWFYRALPLSMLGRFDEASRVLEKAHEVAPQMVGAAAMLSDESLFAGDLRKAEEWNSRLKAIPGSRDAAHSSDAQIAIFKGDFRAAREAIDQLGTSAEPMIRVHAARYRADLAAEQGDYSAAAQILSQAIGEYGPQPLLLLDRAHAECLLKRLGPCLDDIEKATEGDPSPQMLLRASETLGQASEGEQQAGRTAILERLLNLERRLPSEDLGVLSEDAKHRLHGERLLAEDHLAAALEEFRKSDSLEAPYVGREYLGRAFERMALSEKDRRRACESVHSALCAYAVSALHPAIIWELHDHYPPGYYAETLSQWIELSAPATDANDEYAGALEHWSALRNKASLPQRPALLPSCSMSF